MARLPSQPSRQLDSQIEASLRRQFAVPAVGLLPSAMVAGGLAAGAGAAAASGGGFRLDFSLDFSLRQAAGIALAASLWMGAGYLFFAQQSGTQQAAVSSSSHHGLGIDPDTPVAHLLATYDEARLRTPAGEPDPVQEALWLKLQDEMVKRRGVNVLPHIRQLKSSGQVSELYSIESGTDEHEGSLFVTARVDDVVASALIQVPRDTRQQDIGMPGVAEVPTPETVAPQLFLTSFPDGRAVEVAAAGNPLLLPLLVPDATVDSTLPLERGRNRKVHAVAATPPPGG
jgi:hypothetical protein